MLNKKRKKHTTCLNCGFEFIIEDDNYCPRCGQENDDKRKAVIWFIRDFIEDLISIDNRLFQSFVPFLFRPGHLTKAYLAGRRKTYVSPIRLYLTLSIFYFFIFTYIIEEQADFGGETFAEQSLAKNLIKSDKEKDTKVQQIDSLIQVIDSLKGKDTSDTLALVKTNKRKKKKSSRVSRDINVFDISLREVARLMDQPGMTEEKVLDSLNMEKTFLNRLLINRCIHASKLSPQEIMHNYLQKTPLMMFFVLPIFALILTIFYYRRYYVENLVFTLHIHSFWYLILTVLIASAYWIENFPYWLIPVGIVLICFYNYKAFRNVYKQSRVLTLFKLFLLFIIYLILLIFAIAVSFIINFFIA